jgi:hypothetical protein
MTWNLFLDDERHPEDVTWAPCFVQEKYRVEEWIISRSYDDAMSQILNRGFPRFVSFDHDLGETHAKTGYDLAKQLVENDIMSGDYEDLEHQRFPKEFNFYVHSQNPIGKQNIEAYLNNYMKYKG